MALGYSRRTGELPLEVTGFVGRSAELDRIRELLARARLVTLVGPGGVGKSRLALRAALTLKGSYADGIVLAELSSLHDPELLPQAVASALGLAEQSGRVLLDVVMEHLQERRLLLVLDTCEHHLDACAFLADLLLREAPGVTLLATSRQPLDVPGEHTLHVPPLAYDDAATLFEQRAAAVVPGFRINAGNHQDVLALCRRLDCIPLAIELATVRLRAIPLDQLTARLEHRFRVLTGGRRSAALPRHQTLRTAIDWSHDLCSAEERLLWARLSVFAGPFDLAAVEEVCSGAGLPREEIIEHLIGLVDKSVVLRVLDGDDGSRYRLLDTIREYGADRCAALGGEQERCRARHRTHYLARVQHFYETVLTSEQVPLYWELYRDLADLRSALDYSLSRPDGIRPGLEMAARLWPFWVTAGLSKEGRYWLGKGIDADPEPCRERALAMLWRSLLALVQGDLEPALAGFEATREVAGQAGSELDLALATGYTGGVRWLLGDPETGQRLLDEALARQHRINDRLSLVVFHYQKGYMHAVLRDSAAAVEECEKALLLLGDESGECIIKGQILVIEAMAAWGRGEPAECVALARSGLHRSREVHEMFGAANSLELLAWGAAELASPRRAAWLLGAAGALWRKVGSPMMGATVYLDDHARVESAVRAELGEEEFARLFAQGAELPLDRAVELALVDTDTPAVPLPRQSVPPPGDTLTRRERQVAALVSEGLTNREISEQLVISKRTADAHVEHILAKLGFSSRAQIAALAGQSEEPGAAGDGTAQAPPE
ncbi:LuxR family transcriptional regulator [Streptomyces sp. SID10853]|uniref:ATP-binding protein n=1 Tax=Streptomyces sp. SID10853 TaxID=2706028 RepID=UPI0013C1CD9C|nr:LuxR C-terminal-related transcriptional regulator [Streptomyces sp. SID10853]NDZ83075.1 LuxR family transcriptional regulator [Streptomyces sp. SID10853]